MEPVIFRFKNRVVRQVILNGEPGFVAKDVAEALGYKWSGIRTVQHVPEEWRGVESVSTPSGNQDMHILTEPGLYFFLGRSDKQAAVPFQKWLAGDVLPAIRKTGTYSSPNAEQAAHQVIAGPSWEHCERCGQESRNVLLTLQGRMLAKDPLWNDIRKYHAKNLNNKEIGKLVGLGRAALRRQMRAMEECGLLCPRSHREKSKVWGPDLWHKYALPMPYGISAQQGKQLQLFPVGALGGGEG